MITAPDSTCLATVTDEAYLPGTLVLLWSFLRHNPWFTGRIVIIHDGLPPAAVEALRRFPNVTFRAVDARLKARVTATADQVPAVARKARILFALDAFSLTEYARVLKIDSDVLCTGTVAALAATDAPLLACPDQSYYRGQIRDPVTYVAAEVGPEALEARAGDLMFNAGVLSIAPGRLGESTFRDLVDLVRPETWAGVRTGHTDSVILNRYFRGRWTRAREHYNYFIAGHMARYTRPRVPVADAALVHFLGPPKPWNVTAAALHAMEEDRRGPFLQWQAARADWASAP